MSIGATLHVQKHSQAKQAHKLILLELANYANDHGLAWPSVLTLASASGYKPRWVKTVLEDLVQAREMSREKVGRDYHYRMSLYDTKRKTCTCAISAPITGAITAPVESDADEQVQLWPEQVQLLPGYVQLIPQQVQSPERNSMHQKPNTSEPCSEPCLNLKKETSSSPTPPLADATTTEEVVVEDLFQRFWQAYPKHHNKAEARAVWQARTLDDTLPTILTALAWQREVWAQDGYQYVPKPAAYLEDEHWLDACPDAAAAMDDDEPLPDCQYSGGCALAVGAYSGRYCDGHAVHLAQQVYDRGREGNVYGEYDKACAILRQAGALASSA